MEKINLELKRQKMKNPCGICDNKGSFECFCDKKALYNIERRNTPQETISKKPLREDQEKN